MAVDSLGSATNSNFQSGPSINATGRADINTGSSLSVISCDVTDKNLDIFRHELLLTRIKGKHNAYINVISRDSVPEVGDFITSGPDPIHHSIPSIGTCEHEKCSLDMSISTFYADMGDARTDLEYYMAYHQISLHGLIGTTVGLDCLQPNLKIAGAKTHRRHAFFFYNSNVNAQVNDTQDTGVDTLEPAGPNSPPFLKVRQMVAAPHRRSDDPSNLNDVKVYYIDCADAYWLAENNTKMGFKYGLMLAFASTISAEYKPKVTVSAKGHTNVIEPPEFRYAGVALTDACMHAERGDTAVTVNHYSAMTTQNGPYDVYVGDDIGWMFNAERKNLNVDGNRIARNVVTYSILWNLLVREGPGAAAIAARENLQRQMSEAAGLMHEKNMAGMAHRAQKDMIGNLKDAETASRGKYKRFLFVPLKHGSHITKRASIMDGRRRIGKAISSCKAYGRVDWVNGASSEM